MAARIVPCSYAEAEHAVYFWHYSKSYPAGVSHRFGLWEGSNYMGCVLFGTGANKNIGSPFGLDQLEIRELCRVALADDHVAPTSHVVAEALRLLKASAPQTRLVISYADANHGHHGGIYQAGNWLYLGETNPESMLVVNGTQIHRRMAYDVWGSSGLLQLRDRVDANVTPINTLPKYKYAYPFDNQIRRRLLKMAMPYPHAVQVSEATRPVPDGEMVGSFPAHRSHRRRRSHDLQLRLFV